jgi:hypothetical protein
MRISLSTYDYEDIVGAVYDIIEQKTGTELTNADYDTIEETIVDLVERLNENTDNE